MKHALQLSATQHFAITPQLQQALRLLQLSALEFEQEVEATLARNPFLEADERDGADGAEGTATPGSTPSDGGAASPDGDTVAPEDFAGRVRATAPRDGYDEGVDAADHAPAQVTLHDYLLEQVRASRLGERDKLVAGVLVEALDDDGYLRQTPAELACLLPPQWHVEAQEFAIGLRFVQSLDPAGVGARSPGECLRLQLERLPRERPGRELALAIVDDHLDALAAHDTLRLTHALGCDQQALRVANGLILGLDPHPGRAVGPADARFVVADVIVRRRGGRWVATINPDVLPRIRVNELYVDILRRSRTRANGELAQQLQEARWLVRNVQQRFQTIRRVAQAIVDRQERFFDHGDLAMKPLFRRDIARALDMHESTISRVTCDKYMATPRGLIEFAHFFGSHLVADGGYACSATAIRALIRHMIATEDAAHPLSDVKLTRKLGERGVRIGRRTVTKYRDALRIPPVEARRMAPSRSPERRCEANPTAVAD